GRIGPRRDSAVRVLTRTRSDVPAHRTRCPASRPGPELREAELSMDRGSVRRPHGRHRRPAAGGGVGPPAEPVTALGESDQPAHLNAAGLRTVRLARAVGPGRALHAAVGALLLVLVDDVREPPDAG